MAPDELRAVQWARLLADLPGVLRSNRFHQDRFRRAGLALCDLNSPADLAKIPYTTKADLVADQEANPPFGTNLTRPPSEYCRLHQTSGTTGRKLSWLDDRESWRAIMDVWEAIFAAAQVRDDDRFFFPFSFGPFLGFWGAFDAASRKNRFVVTAGGMTTAARLQLLIDSECTFVLCTPTYALRLAEVAEETNLELTGSKVRGLILAGEPGACAVSTRARLESAFDARVFDHYGMTEIGPLSAEFVAHPAKAFLLEQTALAEFIDPKTGEPVAEGELGELVVTNLRRWASPLFRYRTGDLVRWRRQADGDATPSIYLEGGVLGRVDDMVWIKGNNVFPTAVEQIVREFDEVGEFVIEAACDGSQTQLTIQIEPRAADASPDLAAALARRVQDRLYFRPRVVLMPLGSLPRYEMKAQRFKRTGVK